MFKHQGCLPITNEPILNEISEQKGFHLSYNPSSRDYGSDTTAIVLGNHALFFLLNGDHREALSAAVDQNGKQGAVDYFIENIGQANRMSDHAGIFEKDTTILRRDEHALEHLGAENVARIQAAVNETQNAQPQVNEDAE